MTRLLAEDLPFLVGAARFTADLDAADAWHVRFVRSPQAHAVLRGIARPAPASMPTGTDGAPSAAILTEADLGYEPYTFFPAVGHPRPLLAGDRVRYVGDPVALVAAADEAAAVDLAEAVELDLEPLAAQLDLWAALEDPDRIVNTIRQQAETDPLAGAALVVQRRCVNPRLSPLPLETSAIVVRPLDGGRGLDVWAACQGVHAVRDDLAAALGLDPAAIRVRAPSVGGGFGARYRPPLEYLTVAAAALRLGRPLRWVEDRTEQLLSQAHGRGHELDVALGVRADGRFTGVRVRGVADAGAYPGQAPLLVEYTRKMAPGPYRMPLVDFEVSSVTTTTAPVGAYRGAGQPEIVTAVETLVDEAARALGLSPAELRRRNLLQPEELPTVTVTGVRYDRADLPAALATVTEKLDSWRAADAVALAGRGPSVRLGYGLACYAQITAVGQLTMGAQLTVRPDGTVVAGAGSHSHGQGHRSTFAHLVGERLGIDPAAIDWVDADTGVIPAGHGTGGSRSAALTGNALHHVAEALLERARRLVADHLEADPADIVVGAGGLAVAGVPASLVGWAAIVALAEQAGLAGPDGMAISLVADPAPSNTPYGAHGCVVAVDTETGGVTVLHHIAVDDCGLRLSPSQVEGQQHGGAVAGIAQALGEQIVYAADGTPLTTTLIDYVVPAASEVPSIDVAGGELAADTNAVGARGIGENGAIAATPAVLNAVADALGVPFVGLPLTPERIWRLADAR